MTSNGACDCHNALLRVEAQRLTVFIYLRLTTGSSSASSTSSSRSSTSSSTSSPCTTPSRRWPSSGSCCLRPRAPRWSTPASSGPSWPTPGARAPPPLLPRLLPTRLTPTKQLSVATRLPACLSPRLRGAQCYESFL
ncbi:hypothetical protein L7F22_064809 [Adiantum nelumboides]|nr:hypothetical protein [Adiantum nelumboides]